MDQFLPIAVVSQPIYLVSFVTIGDVSPFIGLEVPWRDNDHVINPYPGSPLHLPPDPA